MFEAGGRRRWRPITGTLAGATLALLLPGCAALPAEFNLSPVFRQRLDAEGRALEVDVLWPLFHYERTPEGGDDFRIRPFWRRITGHDPTGVVEHQFLWPFGRSVADPVEQSSRLFPFWWHRDRENDKGQRETDWYFLFPFVWGGSGAGGTEDYLAVFPLYADIPQFLTYDRFQAHLFPLHLYTEKGQSTARHWLWPLIGAGSSADGRKSWHKVLPFYAYGEDLERYRRHSFLWPFLSFSTENLHTDNPYSQYALWPLFGRQRGTNVDGWWFLWPFFGKQEIIDRTFRLSILWPFFHYFEDRSPATPIRQWWIWPLYGQVVTDDQRSWSALWPLIWWREFDDPEGMMDQQWVLPFYWRVHRSRPDGTDDDFIKLWPFWHSERNADGSGDFALLSPWPWRAGNAYGVDEAYGWLWTLARGRTRAPDDHSFELAAHMFSTRSRNGQTKTSMPFLFNYESDPRGGTLRLLQFLPIRFTTAETGVVEGK